MNLDQDMFRLRVVAMFYLVAFVVVNSGCKKLLIGSKVAENKQTTTLFDQLIAKSHDGKVPYPFSKLLAYLSQYADPVPILIPISRSQQRHAASFKDPRRVVGFRTLRPNTERRDGVDIHARLFLGYVEKLKQIEIMSLTAGRETFDFQLIDNYSADDKPVVKLANKKNCISCHQHGGPIFTPRPWAETNFSTNFVVTLLQHFHPKGDIDSIPLDQNFESTARDFELLVRDAADILFDNKIWSAQCVGDKQAVCRANVLKNLFSLHELCKPADFMLQPTFTHPLALIPDRNMTILLPVGSEKYLEDYPLSAQATAILKRMIAEEDKKHTQSNFPRALIATYIRGEGEIEMTTPRLLQQLPKLQDEQRNLLYREMASIIMHVHKKDLHTNTTYDPLTKRDNDFDHFPYNDNEKGIRTLSPKGAVGEIINRLRDIFVQQTLLPKNKRYWSRLLLKRIVLNNIYIKKTSDPAQEVITSFFGQALLKVKTKDTATYVRADSADTAYLEFRELTVHVAKDPYSKPKRVSKVVFDGRAGKYEFDFLCRASPDEHIIYTCSAFDQWQMEDAITNMLQDKSSPLYQSYLQPRVVISKILAALGYSLPIKQDTQQQDTVVSHQDQAVYVPTNQDKVGQSLYQHCGDCHANRNDEYNFLYVRDAQTLCANIRRYVNSVELQKSGRDIIFALTSKFMPPNDSTYADELSQIERSALVNALKENKLPFCK